MYWRRFAVIVGLLSSFIFSRVAMADTIISGDLKIHDGGELVFSDGSVQSKAQMVGSKGDKGDAGPQGPAGGPPNTLTIGVVFTGSPGTAASAAITGTAPNQVMNFILPQGVKGDVGPVGPAGPQGPKSDTGLTGPIGPQGLQGPKGDAGPAGPQGPVAPLTLDMVCAVIYAGGAQLPTFCSAYGLTSISLTPVNPIMASAGTNIQFGALGKYTDGSTRSISSSVVWSSGSLDIATINAAGLATGVATGASIITATLGTKSANG